jgi:hypothetical protein
MDIEFAYSAETAFVSPTLLGIGIQHRNMTLIWCLSPMIGSFSRRYSARSAIGANHGLDADGLSSFYCPLASF